jgi:NAD(P)-dependent dehydrogenase (short-subunit alcohol dehydrogenase family)
LSSVLITGPSQSGIGAQVALSLATASPKLLILAGRSPEKVAPVVDEIKSISPNVQVEFVELNLLSNESVRQAVKQIKASTKTIDILINNAGVMATRKFLLSENGIESQFAANYLGHFLLTNLLLKEGVVRTGGVVLNVGSLGYQMADIHFDDINFKVSFCLGTSELSIVTNTYLAEW